MGARSASATQPSTRTAPSNGGGVYNLYGNISYVGTLTAGNTSVNNNTATGNGGGIDNEGGTVNLPDTTVNGNSAVNGGGVYNDVITAASARSQSATPPSTATPQPAMAVASTTTEAR